MFYRSIPALSLVNYIPPLISRSVNVGVGVCAHKCTHGHVLGLHLIPHAHGKTSIAECSRIIEWHRLEGTLNIL